MNESKLGDSFDSVKRLWPQILPPEIPVLAHPWFIPAALRIAFSRLTGIPIWNEEDKTAKCYALLLDPDTGVPLPDAMMNKLSISHAPINFIADLFTRASMRFIICFDQSANRNIEPSVAAQLDVKRQALRE